MQIAADLKDQNFLHDLHQLNTCLAQLTSLIIVFNRFSYLFSNRKLLFVDEKTSGQRQQSLFSKDVHLMDAEVRMSDGTEIVGEGIRKDRPKICGSKE
jgi:hypothetical protein